MQQLTQQRKLNKEEEQKDDKDDDLIVEDPDQVDPSKLEQVGPHQIIKALLDMFKSNGKFVADGVLAHQNQLS